METNKEGYSLKSQSTKGLSTFVLTLSISLIVFSAIYYMMTTNSVSQEDYKVEVVSESKVTEETAQQPISQKVEENTQPKITQNTENVETAVEVKKEEVKKEDKTVFGKLASSSPEDYKGQVLAGTDPLPSGSAPVVQQSTTSNLETGVTSITAGLVSSFILFISAMVFIYRNPRKLALNTFEKKITSRK